MISVRIGPNLCEISIAISNYVSHILNPTELRMLDYNEEDDEIEMTPLQGVYELDDVKVTFLENNDIYALDSRLTLSVNITISSEKIETIKKFLATCNEFAQSSMNTGVTPDSIKVFHNDFGWETETIVKKRSIESVQLPSKIKENLLKDLENFLNPTTKEKYKSLEIPYNRIYMFYGPPGTGKTTLIQALASHFDKNIANIEFDNETSDRTFKKMLRRVPPNTIVCIEDIDCLFEDRKALDCAKNSVTFSGILNALDGISKLDQKIIIITTNHLNRLDDALKRRIDHFTKFEYSTKLQVNEMYKRFFPNSDDFNTFWEEIKDLKVTPNILQKLFVRHLNDPQNINTEAREFITGEHSVEIVRDLYT